MKRKYIYGIVILLVAWLLWIGTIFLVKIDLNGPEKIYLTVDDEYIEQGAKAHFLNTRLSIRIDGVVNTKIGKTYHIYYLARNPFGIVRKIKRTVVVKDKNKPVIKLRGNQTMVLKVGEDYKEPGYEATDLEDGNITNKVIVKKELQSNKIGLFKITYTVFDKAGNKSEVVRNIRRIPKDLIYQQRYDDIDNTRRGWGHNNKRNHQRPVADASSDVLALYGSYYMGADEKVIYLTFDEGSNDTYMKEIFQVLKEKKVKATIFLCRKYMLDNASLVKEMIKDKQVIGNHTSHHKMMPDLATRENYDKYKQEIIDNEKAYKEITGNQMPKIYREPAGEWSYRSLSIVQDMGYRTYFWSAAYLDFAEDLTKEKAYQHMMELHHNGAIYLLHPKNKGNYLALADFIDKMKSMGYRFDTVDKIG